MAASFRRPFDDRRFRWLVWAIVGVTGWAGVVLLGAVLASQDPPHAGFDLTLILDAGRRVAAGTSPYVGGAVGSGTPVESLFFSYPPPVAQAASLLAGLPNAFVLVALAACASVGFGLVAATLARAGRVGDGAGSGAGQVADVVLPALALAPFAYPFAVALLFGNLDALFPLAYGAVLVAVTTERGRWRIGGGLLLGLITVAKVHPAALLVWLAVAGLAARRSTADARRLGKAGTPAEWVVLAAALVTVGTAIGVSLFIGGTGPWADYIGVVRSASQADLATSLNIGPASQIALTVGQPGVASTLAVPLGILAVAAAALAGWAIRSRGLSFTAASAASLVVLPVTWFHYPVAFLPVAVHAWAGARGSGAARRTGWFLVGALLVAGLAIVAPVTVWLAVVLVAAAERAGRAND